MQLSKIVKWLGGGSLLIGFIIGLSFLIGSLTGGRPAPIATVPAGVNPNDIPFDATKQALHMELVANQPGFLAYGIRGAYGALFPNLFSTFHARDGEFVGQGFVFNGDTTPHQITAFCLVDYIQHPCTPDAKLVQEQVVAGANEWAIDISLSSLSAGHHVLGFWVIDKSHLSTLNFNQVVGSLSRADILVGDSEESAIETPIISLSPQEAIENASAIALFTEETTLPAPGAGDISYVRHIVGNPTERVTRFLHFHDTDNRSGETLAVLALIDNEQVPLYYEGVAYKPLYVARERNQWQTLMFEIELPSEPGMYELIIGVQTHAFELLEYGRPYPVSDSFMTSDIVIVEVVEP